MPDLIGHLVQKHSKTARSTLEKKGTASSFRMKVHEVSPKLQFNYVQCYFYC